MATRRWKGTAIPVAQVTTIAISGTWATSDTATITINGKDLVLTVGTDTTTAQIATAIKEMFNGEAQAGTGDHTFSETGNDVPEFNEITASVASSTVTLTADTAGKPFTVSVSESTAGSGAVGTPTEATAPTGPNHFDNADNWSGGAVPVDGDDIVIDQGDVGILYGLDQSAVTPASIKVTNGFTGTIGLPEVNIDAGASNSYFEYRSQYLALGNSADATNTAVDIGGGEGSASGRIKLDTGSGQITANVKGTGQRAETAVPTLLWKGTHASNEFNVTKGDVGIAFFAGESATVATLRVGYQENQDGDSTVELNDGCTLVEQTGGTLTVRDNVTQFDQRGGESFIEGTAAITTLNLDEGDCRYKSTGTLATANVGGGGNLDFRQDQRTRVLTTLNLYAGSEFHDPFDTVEDGSGNRGPATFTIVRAALEDVVVELPENISLTLSAAVAPGGGDHGTLTGLSDDDHTQYLLVSGSRAMTGNLDLGGNSVIFAGATVTDVTGSDTLLVSGTAGTNGNLAQWNADGDLVDSGAATSEFLQNVVEDTTPQLGGDLDAQSNKITSLGAPTADGDAANKSYVDAATQGLDVKDSVRVATTTAGTLASDFENGDTVDGVTLATGDRILIKDQSTGSENGIYVVAASGAPARASDLAAADEAAGVFVFVEEGTSNADSGWLCTSDDGSDVVGTDSLTFVQFSGAGQITAGDGLAKSGNTLSVNVDDSTIEINSDTLRAKDAGITYAKIQNVSATNKVLGRSTAGAGSVEEIDCTAFARTLLDDADAATARTTLGISSSVTPLIVPSRLEHSSATELVLTQVAGKDVWNPLTSEQADVSSEPTVDTTGLSADTLYQVYLDTGTAALSIESTAATQTNGIYHKSGDTGRLLVGWVYTNGSTQFADSETERHVASLHHARPRKILKNGAFENNITADATWRTPTTDMVLSYIRHPYFPVEFHCAVSLRHDSGGGYCRAGIDVGATGTPQTNNYIQLGSASEVATIGLLALDEAGAASRRQSRVRVMGENVGAATFDIYSGGSYLKGTTWG